jgi:hypothetical protein
MITTKQSTTIEGDKAMNTNHQKENNMKPTAAKLSRWAGLAAMGAGSLFMAIQAIHPPDVLSSVTTPQWSIVHYLGVAMGLLGLLGITGLYARQVEEAGWLGLAGYLLFTLFWGITLAFQFVEALISPVVATVAPELVESLLGMVGGHAGEIDLGALPAVWTLTGLLYMLSGLLFGIATFRAGILPRWAAGLLVIGVILPLLGASLVPHPFDRIFAVPVGISLVWLGYALWSEPREQASQPAPILRSV